jgi:transcriptional regulator with XRE-family HTH domain
VAKRARIPHFDNPSAVGERLLSARTAAHLSQRDLAFAGCSAAYISRIEHGERIPSLQVMRELARRTGVSEEQLAYGRGDILDSKVAQCVREAEEAETAGSAEGRQRAYLALSRAASRAAKASV